MKRVSVRKNVEKVKKSNGKSLRQRSPERTEQETHELYQIIFPLLSNAVFGKRYVVDIGDNWEKVFRELAAQTVAAVPAEEIKSQPLSREQMKQYSLYVAQHVILWNRILHQQQILTKALCREGIVSAVLKGAAAAVYYPKPEYRCMGDIDLIVLPEDFDRAREILKHEGCVLLDANNERHESFEKDGVHIELHHYFSTLHEEERARYLDQRILEGLRRVEYRKLGGYTFPKLPAVENGLVLLQHMCQHLESGLGLRQIMDWMLYVDAELTDELWEAEFEAAAERIGLKKLAVVSARMCQMYLGLTKERTWCKDADSVLCRQLIEYVIRHGNFGRKDRFGSIMVPILNSLRNPAAFFRMAQKSGCLNWKVLDRHPWLSPVAWLYQLCRWARKGLRYDRKGRSVFRAVRHAGKEDQFLDSLGVRRRKKM